MIGDEISTRKEATGRSRVAEMSSDAFRRSQSSLTGCAYAATKSLISRGVEARSSASGNSESVAACRDRGKLAATQPTFDPTSRAQKPHRRCAPCAMARSARGKGDATRRLTRQIERPRCRTTLPKTAHYFRLSTTSGFFGRASTPTPDNVWHSSVVIDCDRAERGRRGTLDVGPRRQQADAEERRGDDRENEQARARAVGLTVPHRRLIYSVRQLNTHLSRAAEGTGPMKPQQPVRTSVSPTAVQTPGANSRPARRLSSRSGEDKQRTTPARLTPLAYRRRPFSSR